MTRWNLVNVLGLTILLLAGCEETTGGNDGGTDAGSNDGGTGQCPPSLPTADIRCDTPGCNPGAGSATKTFGLSDLTSEQASNWMVVSWATSEFASDNENTTVEYTKEVTGGLVARGLPARVREAMSPEDIAYYYSQRRLDRVRLEAEIRARAMTGPVALDDFEGTAITGVRDPLVQKQSTACSSADTSPCGTASLCVIPEGTTDGLCEAQLNLKWSLEDTNNPVDFTATVRKVGQEVAVVVDDVDNANVQEADVDAIIERFDNHISKLDHALFGNPAEKDKDQNGVVIILLTSKLTNVGAEFVGVFFPDDMRPTAQAPHSNAADLLYMQPPGANVNIDQLSGTVAHEYEHLLSFTSKVIINQNAEPETVWLDEGLATFAEDIAGYGEDSFANVKVYLFDPAQTSLTGFGQNATDPVEADSNERRGMSHLMMRYLFEQAGGASFGSGPGDITDNGGVALIRSMVASGDTGFDALLGAAGGKTFDALLGDLLTTIAVDDTALECVDGVGFDPVEAVDYTSFQRGVALRTTISAPSGQSIELKGPNDGEVPEFDTAEGVDLALNGGEFLSVSTPSGGTRITVGGPAEDIDVAYRAIALP